MTQTTLNGRFVVQEVFSSAGGMSLIYRATDSRCADNEVLIKTPRYDGPEALRHFQYGPEQAQDYIKGVRALAHWERKVMCRFRRERIPLVPALITGFEAASMSLPDTFDGRRGEFGLPDEVRDSEPFIAMEWVHGDSLESLASDPKSTVPQRLLLNIARSVCTALIKMHKPRTFGTQQGYFLFQDLKPANLLVGPADTVRLVDFGGVTLRLGERTTEPTAGVITTGYAAPEAEEDPTRIDERFDIYGLGATLYHAATGTDPREMGGQFPFLNTSHHDTPHLDRDFVQWIDGCLVRDPKKRFQSASEARRALIPIWKRCLS